MPTQRLTQGQINYILNSIRTLESKALKKLGETIRKDDFRFTIKEEVTYEIYSLGNYQSGESIPVEDMYRPFNFYNTLTKKKIPKDMYNVLSKFRAKVDSIKDDCQKARDKAVLGGTGIEEVLSELSKKLGVSE